MKNDNRDFAIIAAVLFPFAALYFAALPSYVQGGDTAELVSAARHHFVAHPPGYPLWIWLQSFWLKIIPAGTEFWRASFLSAVVVLNALALFIWPIRGRILHALIILPVLALSPAIIEAAILPDVFGLHFLFTIAIGSLYLSQWPGRFRTVPFLFALSLANHHATVFLAPIIAGLWYEEPSRRKAMAKFFGAGLLTTAALYLSILAMNTQSPFSWANISTLSELAAHVLRFDYGTFRLQAQDHARGFEPLIHFFRHSLLGWTPLIAFCAYLTATQQSLSRNRRLWVLSASVLLSCAFFLLSNVPTSGIGAEVLVRFHVMPLALVALAIREVLLHARPTKAIWAGVLANLFFVLPSLTELESYIGLRADSVIEDYAHNFLVEADRRRPALILAESDAAYFAMRYLQAQAPDPSGIAVIRKSLFFHSWYEPKIKALLPEFELPASASIAQNLRMNLQTELIDPNIQRISILLPAGFQDGKPYHVKFLGIGRQLSVGSGISIDEASLGEIILRTRYQERPEGPQAFTRAWLFSQYSHVYMTGRAWAQALDIVPYAYPALDHLCQEDGTDPRCGEEFRESIRRQSIDLF